MRVSLSRSVMTLAMLGIFVVLVFIASGYPPNARFMPFVVGVPAIGLCILQLVLDQRGRRTTLDAGPPAPEPGVRNAGPEVPRGQPWKEGVIAALGANVEPPVFWKQLLGRVTSWTDLEPPLIGAVEQLIDFVTEPT